MLDDTRSLPRPGEFVEGLSKGLLILECFDAQHSDMTLTDVARRVGLSPAAARRSLLTLMAMGYVGQVGKRFHLRPKVMSLGSAFYSSARVDEVFQPELRRLVEKFGDASSVATLEGNDVIYIAHYSEQRARRVTAVVGVRYPAHVTSLGRVLLAGQPEADLERYLRDFVPSQLTRTTVVDKAEIGKLIERARDERYATTVDQLDYGITALSVPIRDASGRTIAALNTSAYSGATTADELVTNRLEELRYSAARIEQTLSRLPVIGSIIGSR